MTKRYRLLARAQMHGEVRDPGYIFVLGDGEVGPHRTVAASHQGAQITDRIGEDVPEGALVDEPMYTELTDKENAALDEVEAKQIEEADKHAEACAERDRALAGQDERAPGLLPTGNEVRAEEVRDIPKRPNVPEAENEQHQKLLEAPKEESGVEHDPVPEAQHEG